MIVLTLNSGSSSLKFGLYSADGSRLEMLMTGVTEAGTLRARDVSGAEMPGTPIAAETPEATIRGIVALLAHTGLPAPEAIGHRVVHGGAKLRVHRLIDAAVERELEAACALSPLHGPVALAIIRLARAAWPDAAQAACLDTAFHVGMPDVAGVLPVARELQAEGVQRYGFHGLSCESIVRQLGPTVPSRTVIAHLGSGASVTAVRDARSVDTSMGLTPSGGIVMGTRSGDLDPGVLIFLLRERRYDAAALEDLIDHRSGLLGVSGLSGDLGELRKAEQSSPDARLAITMFCLSAAKAIASMIVVLGGVDAIVFTGGIGEHDEATRTTICQHLDGLGIELDSGTDIAGGRANPAGPRCRLHVLPAREDDEIAWHTSDLVAARR